MSWWLPLPPVCCVPSFLLSAFVPLSWETAQPAHGRMVRRGICAQMWEKKWQQGASRIAYRRRLLPFLPTSHSCVLVACGTVSSPSPVFFLGGVSVCAGIHTTYCTRNSLFFSVVLQSFFFSPLPSALASLSLSPCLTHSFRDAAVHCSRRPHPSPTWRLTSLLLFFASGTPVPNLLFSFGAPTNKSRCGSEVDPENDARRSRQCKRPRFCGVA